MVTTSSTKKVTLKAYQQHEKEKKAAQRKAAASISSNGGVENKTADNMVPTPGQVQVVVPQIVVTEITDTSVKDKQADEVAGPNQAGSFLRVPASGVADRFASKADEVLEAAAENFSGLRYIIPTPIDMAIQYGVLNHPHPEVLYHPLNQYSRQAMETFLIDKMDDARSMLHRMVRMGRIGEQHGYNIPVGRSVEYEDVVGISEGFRDWMLQPVDELIESVGLLPDFATDTSTTSSAVIYTPASSFPASPMNAVFPGDISAMRVSDEDQVTLPTQLPAMTDRRVPIPQSILEKVARQRRVQVPAIITDRRVPIPQSILEKVARLRQNRVGSLMNLDSSTPTDSTDKVSPSYSPQKMSYVEALSGGSPDGSKKASGLRTYIPNVFEKMFGQGRKE